MARPSRASERRAELVAVARRAVVDRGVLDLRLRDIADGAGMSSGSVLYYFPSLAELLQEVQRDAVERFCDAREREASSELTPPARLRAMIGSGLPTGPDDELCVLLYELGTIARRDPAYAARHIALYERQVRCYTAILEAGAATGVFDLTDQAVTIARNLVALEDGYGLHLTQAVAPLERATAVAMLLAYARTSTRCALEDVS
ncbi:TetR/AcrR family transcriptional regulator [Amycolatopsis sp. 195334CR]|uniref:TetR/AcrR family transcriptional regulator n=1 Tax=Amycolatopsis sp. 195334CR TaxID=2814588 RepID=UPI001A8E875B|nr:TetR/AcrR family transcriptional regulator [Amycolatopsis sp. 195334CR]MBN6041058.1 TetR family transcriptional regulator C-terminal domain-containing protein [Amycolatopsis sp. 195334CR]